MNSFLNSKRTLIYIFVVSYFLATLFTLRFMLGIDIDNESQLINCISTIVCHTISLVLLYIIINQTTKFIKLYEVASIFFYCAFSMVLSTVHTFKIFYHLPVLNLIETISITAGLFHTAIMMSILVVCSLHKEKQSNSTFYFPEHIQ